MKLVYCRTRNQHVIMNEETASRIREWIEVDNNIRVRREKLKMLCEKRTTIESQIKNYIKKNKLEGVQINVSDGHVKFSEKNNIQNITLKYLKEQLDAFFLETHDKDAETLYKYILGNRKVSATFEMVREIKDADEMAQ